MESADLCALTAGEMVQRVRRGACSRREIVAAVNASKPIILLCESDPDKGATDLLALRAVRS